MLGDGGVEIVAQRTAVVEVLAAIESGFGCLQVAPIGDTNLRPEGLG